jgi:glycosyltransferase involved in cell wall biosynthesis
MAEPIDSVSDSVAGPPLSVVIPVRDDPEHLALCLGALAGSQGVEFELIVVDDGSVESVSSIAAAYGAQFLRLESSAGPAAARNLGAAKAQFDHLMFIDADVRVYPQTLALVAARFREEPELAALFGSYDQSPTARNLISQYRNLQHHYVHQTGASEASTFWSGCGAIRRDIFEAVSGFSVDYTAPSIEDIELGGRLRKLGHRIALDKNIQVTHMKRWTLWGMIKCDVLFRGVPWTRLLLKEGAAPNDLNLRHEQRIAALLSYALVACLLAGSWYYRSVLLVPLGVAGAVVALDYWTLRRPVPRIARWFFGVSAALAVLGLLVYMVLGHHVFQLWALLALVALGALVLLNLRFYLFFAKVKGPGFALLVIPLHVLYYLYGGLALAAGTILYSVDRYFGPEAPSNKS